jgi:long-chain fatty acid transport protein
MTMFFKRSLLLLGLTTLLAAPAWALDGHLLHGIGAVNSSMGGAGAALPDDALGALNANPALLTRLDGHKFEFSSEILRATNTLSSSAGPFSGTTKDSSALSVLPAFGWTYHAPGSNVAFGMGFLGLAGFGVDYRQDPNNPILAQQPFGAGRVFSNYQMLKIPLTAAFQLAPNFSLGLSLNAERATLEVTPAGFAAPDCSPSSAGPVCYLPGVASDSRFGFGATVGALWEINPSFNLGGSYTSKTKFQSFDWNATHANPNLPDYGTAREIKFEIDTPAIAVLGIGFKPMTGLSFALDGKWVNYADAGGFGTGAGNLGWQNIKVIAAGVEYKATPGLTLRAGYNHSDNPIPDKLSFNSIIAPAIFQNHACLGLGLKIYSNLDANLALYRVFKNTGSGPFLSPSGPVPGTQVTNTQEVNSAVLTLSFHL